MTTPKTLTSQMFKVLRDKPELLTCYVEDFLVHDRDYLYKTPRTDAAEYLWFVREWSTILINLDEAGTHGIDQKLVEEKTRDYPEAVWFHIEKIPTPDWYGPDYPLGQVREISAIEAWDRMHLAVERYARLCRGTGVEV